MCELTGAAEGPASAVKIHQPPPQVALASRRGLVDAHRDASEDDVADLHSRQHLSAGRLLPQALQVVGGVPDGCDVVARAQPSLEGGLRTDRQTDRKRRARKKQEFIFGKVSQIQNTTSVVSTWRDRARCHKYTAASTEGNDPT